MSRFAALLSAVLTLSGAAIITATVVAIPRLWWGGYVSEAGVASSGHAEMYRLGAWLLALGQLLFALALGSTVERRAAGWIGSVTVGLLVADAAFGGVSASVSCSPGCPLPPHETPTVQDLVHAGASILAVGLLCLAVLSLALLWPRGRLTVPSRIAAAVVTPLVTLDGLAILVVGRGHFTGLLERLVLLGAVVWTVVLCARLITAPRSGLPA
jgi:hypothetical protein